MQEYTMSAKSNKTIASLLAEYEASIAWFDGEDFSLEEAVKRYEKAQLLAREIETSLQSLKNEITQVKQKFDE